MKSGRVSKTALKIALIAIALAEDERWAARLPEGLAALTERLVIAAGIPLYGSGTIRFMKRGILWSRRKHRAAYDGLGRRKLFMNRQVLEAIEAGATQVLVLGAGFDTLCLRLAPRFTHVRWFEIDHPATSAAKARGVAAVGKPDNMGQLAVDLAQSRLSAALAELPQWDAGARTIVVAEGLFMYLTDEQTAELLAEIQASTGAGSRLAFSHLLDHESQGAVTRFFMRAFGEPWLSSHTRQELPEALRGLGWRVLEQDQPERNEGMEGLAVAQPDSAASEGREDG